MTTLKIDVELTEAECAAIRNAIPPRLNQLHGIMIGSVRLSPSTATMAREQIDALVSAMTKMGI